MQVFIPELTYHDRWGEEVTLRLGVFAGLTEALAAVSEDSDARTAENATCGAQRVFFEGMSYSMQEWEVGAKQAATFYNRRANGTWTKSVKDANGVWEIRDLKSEELLVVATYLPKDKEVGRVLGDS